MVTRVWGEVQGQAVIFSREKTANRWVAAVPASLNGTYIIALWAADAAGNTGYVATIKATFDSANLCESFSVLDVEGAFRAESIFHTLGWGGVRSDLTGEPLDWIFQRERIQTKILRCEVCGQ